MSLHPTLPAWKAHLPPGSPPPVMPPAQDPSPEVIELPPGEPVQPVREPGHVSPAQAFIGLENSAQMALRALARCCHLTAVQP
ncbi:MAG: hypothetical protein PSV26_17355 [Polaromonas sp.]|uniref:hypothetical protein n=1 Tax=Polaromonas sp. TaxID=1869339 RepID=UPI002487A454|nr:hypothetical protein [Polaromonas sp.]MDI1239253.1 hypothetical protein [Polaromonas sp.]